MSPDAAARESAPPSVEVMPMRSPAVAARPRLHRPIFISGLRKSGTSMTKDLLDGHRDLYVFPPNEMHFFRFTDDPSVVKDKKAREGDPERLKKLVSEQKFISAMKTRGPKSLGGDIDFKKYERLIEEAEVSSRREVIEVILTSMALATRSFTGDVARTRFVSKSVLETEYVPDLIQWFPDMKFIYVLRNPYGHFNAARWSLRSAGSVDPTTKKFSWWRHPYPYLGPEINRMKLSYYFMRRYQRLYPDHFYVMIYDRLVLDPEPELRKLCAFLELEFDECLLGTTKLGFERKRSGWTRDEARQDNLIDPGPATKWRAQITPLEIRLVNAYFGDVIDDFGFERIESRASLLRPFNLSERPRTFLLNRALFASEVVHTWR